MRKRTYAPSPAYAEKIANLKRHLEAGESLAAFAEKNAMALTSVYRVARKIGFAAHYLSPEEQQALADYRASTRRRKTNTAK